MSTADPVAAGEGAPAAAADSPWAALCQTPLDAGLWPVLARDYQRHELPWQAACAARQALRSDPGARAWLETPAIAGRRGPAPGDIERANLASRTPPHGSNASARAPANAPMTV